MENRPWMAQCKDEVSGTIIESWKGAGCVAGVSGCSLIGGRNMCLDPANSRVEPAGSRLVIHQSESSARTSIGSLARAPRARSDVGDAENPTAWMGRILQRHGLRRIGVAD